MAHIHEKIDFVATAYIIHEGKALLRMHDKYNTWLGIGGHIELDEDPIEALIREVKEESGLEIEFPEEAVRTFSNGNRDLLAPDFLNRHYINKTHEHIDLQYAVKAVTTRINPAHTEKDVEFKWFTVQELEDSKEVMEDVKYHAISAIKKIQSYE